MVQAGHSHPNFELTIRCFFVGFVSPRDGLTSLDRPHGFSTYQGVRFRLGASPFKEAFCLPAWLVGPVDRPPCSLQRPLM